MVALTNSQYLPYPTGTDRRCDAPGTWETFAELIEGKVQSLATIGRRLSPAVPAAVLRRTEPIAMDPVLLNPVVPSFDVVVMDTDGMVDLTLDPTGIRPRRPGRYQVLARASVSAPLAVSGHAQVTTWGGTVGATPVDGESYYQGGPVAIENNYSWPLFIWNSGYKDWWPDHPNATSILSFYTMLSGPDGSVWSDVEFAAFWVRDL